jgi:hypothetical protein
MRKMAGYENVLSQTLSSGSLESNCALPDKSACANRSLREIARYKLQEYLSLKTLFGQTQAQESNWQTR